MSKGKKLSDIEKGQIQAFNEAGHSMRWIARRIGRSFCVVHNYLTRIDTYGKAKSSGRPKKLSSRTERRILAELTNSQKSTKSS